MYIDDSIFSSILSKVIDRDDDDDEAPHKKQVNEHEAQEAANAHDQIYNQNNGQPNEETSSRDMGSAAAMQAFKMFTGGGGNSSGGGSSQLIGLAMGEAMKLFQAQGGSGGKANQGEMLQSAATMAMKLFMTQQSSGSSNSGGGLGQVMGILSSLQGASAPPAEKPSGMASLLGKFL